MAHYWITEAQKYIQSLGFNGVDRRAIDDQPQKVRLNQLGYDNSFETDHPILEIRYGKGGVDDAEDAEVTRKDLGHVEADTLILQGSFDFPGTTMPVLAQRTVDAAQALYGNSVADTVRQAFQARGIL